MSKRIGIGLAWAGLWLCSWLLASCQPATSSGEQPPDSTALNRPAQEATPRVRTQAMRVGGFALTTSATGLLRAPAQSRLSFRIGGTITSMGVHNGSVVSAGQVLARLDDADQRLALRVAEDQLADTLSRSPRTIMRHRENIRLRFGLTGHHSFDQFAQQIRPQLEKWVN